MENEKIIEKIKKVLELSKNNPSEEEAKSAALQAQKLLAKYHIDMAEIESIDLDKTESIDEVKVDLASKKWKYELASVVAKNFRCRHFYYGTKSVVFYGHKTDAEVAAETFKYLFTLGNKLANKEVKRVKYTPIGYETSDLGYEFPIYNTDVKGVYNSFVSGFISGIRDSLDSQCTALALVVPEDVQESYSERTAGFKKSNKRSVDVTNSESFFKGKVEGKNAMGNREIAG